MKNPQVFAGLFSKYLDNRCSPEEVDDLMRLLQYKEYKALANDLIENHLKHRIDNHFADAALKERLDRRLQFILDNNDGQSDLKRRPLYIGRWAAAASMLVLLSAALYYMVGRPLPFKKNAVAKVSLHATPFTGYTRYLILPDGSSVVLHAGGKLEYAAEFTGSTREVRLSGEAYFDIVHNAAKPFIIHTGKVRTTVLGTAFNIKSDDRQVTVSVTRGKVKVESGFKILAVLTPDQQVQYKVPEAVSLRHTVNAANLVTDWTKEDMLFNGISFEEIARLLSKRYGVPVGFKNEALRKCKIRASFSGTETLEQVSSVLSGIRNGSFEQLKDGTILFDGEGCE